MPWKECSAMGEAIRSSMLLLFTPKNAPPQISHKNKGVERTPPNGTPHGKSSTHTPAVYGPDRSSD